MTLSSKVYSYFFVISLLTLACAMEYTNKKTLHILTNHAANVINSEVAIE